jgi:hypothetical protein
VNWIRALKASLTIVATIEVLSPPARADEGGVSFWVPGTFGSLAATPQQPGWSLTFIFYDTSVSVAERLLFGLAAGASIICFPATVFFSKGPFPLVWAPRGLCCICEPETALLHWWIGMARSARDATTRAPAFTPSPARAGPSPGSSRAPFPSRACCKAACPGGPEPL